MNDGDAGAVAGRRRPGLRAVDPSRFAAVHAWIDDEDGNRDALRRLVAPGSAWAWVKPRLLANLAVIGAFLIGLLVGGVLGWPGPGHRTIDWGTAGEWAGGVGTVGAIWAALQLFGLSQPVERTRCASDVEHRLGSYMPGRQTAPWRFRT